MTTKKIKAQITLNSIEKKLLVILITILVTNSWSFDEATGKSLADKETRLLYYGREIQYQNAPQKEQVGSLVEPNVKVRASSGTKIRFKTQNGLTINGQESETIELPHLVLYRTGELTEPETRTLIVEVSGIKIPNSGATITLELFTQHGDPDQENLVANQITVLRESRWIPGDRTGGRNIPLEFEYEFRESVFSGFGSMPTPTDYYGYEINVTDHQHPPSDPLYSFSKEIAFLLENQWEVILPTVDKVSGEDDPRELVVYYCDMFPLRRDQNDQGTWIPRERITDYVGDELVPAMVDAYKKQSGDWGFKWDEAWTSYRPEEDAERLSVALTMAGVWYHGRSPSTAHSGISIRVDLKEYRAYKSLTEGIISLFHHELFHNHQRNINQYLDGNGDISGESGAWRMITEGTAVLAASVGGSDWEFSPMADERNYFTKANTYLAGDKFHNDSLNTSLKELDPYLSSIYWRFLYEQCNGMKGGVENPEAGWRVIGEVLEVLYEINRSSTNSASNSMEIIPEILDTVLNSDQDRICPFGTFQESLTQFAEAMYLLQIEDGRCVEPGLPVGCGFFDPHGLYKTPPLDVFSYEGSSQVYAGAINSSFGVDFIEVQLEFPATEKQLEIEVSGLESGEAEFNVQVWKLVTHDLEDGSQQKIINPADPDQLLTIMDSQSGTFLISAEELRNYDRLGFAITRLDINEVQDAEGGYVINLASVRGE